MVIDNRQGGGRQSRIFLEGADSGSREYMGEVGSGRTLRFCVRRSTFPEPVLEVIERPASETMDPALGQNQPKALRSDEFLLSARDVWTWEVTLNRLVREPNAAGGGGRSFSAEDNLVFATQSRGP